MSSAAPVATKAKKVVSKKSEEVAAPAPVAAPVAAPAAAASAPKKAAAPKKVAVAAPAAAAPVTATASVPVLAATASAPVTATAVETAEAPVVSVQDDVKAMLTQATTVRETVGALVAELKRLEKRVARLQKEADKRRRRSKKVPVEGEEVKPRKPSIFELPTPLSNELCSFLGVSNGSKESRSNVTKAITTYVKAHELKDKHTIKPDAKLKALLGVAEGDVLTYFNLQRYLNRHYLKAPVATA
jgi:chromatin remodeling complex protein RSC6